MTDRTAPRAASSKQPRAPSRTRSSPARPAGQSAPTKASRKRSTRAPAGASAPEPGGHRPPRTRIIAVANQKGGVGKSTTAVSLGAALAELGHRVLVIDLDPQGNASTGLGIRHDTRDITVYDVLAAEAPLADAVVPTPVENLFAVPSTIDLAGAEIELVSQFSRELRLRRALEPMHDAGFDFVFLDCPPSLGLLTVNALAAAEELIVPIQCEYYALEGLGQLLRNVRLVQQNVNPGLQLTGIVMTMFDPRTKLSEQVVEEVRKFFGDRVYRTIIPRTVRLSEAPGFGQPITVYDPRSRGAECYRDLAREVAERLPTDEPMPSFDNIAVSVAPPQEPHVMTAPHPLSRAGSAEEAEPAPTEPAAPVAEEPRSELGGDAPHPAEHDHGPQAAGTADHVREDVGSSPVPPAEVGDEGSAPSPSTPPSERDHEVQTVAPAAAASGPSPSSEVPLRQPELSSTAIAGPRDEGGPGVEPETKDAPETMERSSTATREPERQAEMKPSRVIVFDEPDGSIPPMDDRSRPPEGAVPVEGETGADEAEDAEVETRPKRRWGLFRRGGKR